MNKFKLLSLVSLSLLVINIILLCFIFFSKSNHFKSSGPRKMIIEKLNFDDVQVVKYDSLIQWHRKQIRHYESEIFNLKNQLYSHLSSNILPSFTDSLIQEIVLRQVNIEQIHLKHFGDIKLLCNEQQLNAYFDLTKALATYFGAGPKGK